MALATPYRRIYRKYTAPDGSRYARSKGVPDIPFIPILPPPPTVAKKDVITKFRVTAAGVPQGSGRDAVLFNATNAMLFPTQWPSYGGVEAGHTLTRTPASGEAEYTVPTTASHSAPTTIDGVATPSNGTGTPIVDREFYGTVRLGTVANVLFKNCRFYGTLTTGTNIGCVEGSNLSLRNAVFQDCEFIVRNNNTWHTGVRGSNYTMMRSSVVGAADAVSWNATGGNVKLLGCWLHDGAYDEWAAGDTSFPSQGSNYLHCDGVQAGQGSNYYARGCFIGGNKLGQFSHHAGSRDQILAGDDFYNSAVLLAQAPGGFLITGTMEQCVLLGGTATVNVATANGYDLSGFTFKDNIFPYRPGGGGQWYILRPVDCRAVMTNNRHPDGVLVPIVTG